ncbi:MAG TPA: hypothetical protein VMG10_03990 [Gemmataceae bacterium]|nr:hypothetical protein [Gemmataceae bacterium]
MMKRISCRSVVALCLTAALMMSSLGCQPGGGSGSAPGTNKPATQKPDNKSKPSGHHEPDPG